ncbi:unnamed protein product [Danaus chrysippus]|uniref:(African queen) hypothetical protein n=1 Tax=Danaus chrysippus TaxID=151541 RepID=A0A8J2QV73_9NEOP|nr:unnamed protein product [Danaus chrysippus]
MLYCEGALNNLPDENALKTAQAIKDLVTNLTDNDFLIVLLSGGGSALLPLPKEPITLEEKTALIKKLANSGADIIELNTVRKRLSDLKGGKLALKAQPASVLTLILSDVVNDPIDLIASGPTCKDEEDPLAAMNIIRKYKLQNELPSSIKKVLEDTRSIEIYPKNKVENIIIGSNKLSIEAAALEAKTIGFFPLALSYSVVGNVSEIAHKYVQLVKLFYDFKNGILHNNIKDRLYELNLPGFKFNIDDEYLDSIKTKDLCLILGGETTVNVKGTGKGGRNQQLALEFSKYIDEIKNDLSGYNIFLLSAGTDGIDGPTDAAGAIGYINLISDCSKENIDVNKYINNNDSYNFFKTFKNGDLHVITGHTNTNVMDIHLIIIQKCT